MLRPLITESDRSRLASILARDLPADAGPLGRLREKLRNARVVEPTEIPPTVVTMRSRVACWVMETGDEREMTLVYPWEVTPGCGRVSVTSEIGAQLLGAVPGTVLFDRNKMWRVLWVAYQPEARGEHVL